MPNMAAACARVLENMAAIPTQETPTLEDYFAVFDYVFEPENFALLLKTFPDHELPNLIRWKREYDETKAALNRQEHLEQIEIEIPPPTTVCKKRRRSKKKPVAPTVSTTEEEVLRLKQEKEELELERDVANLALANERIEQQREINALKQSVLEAQRQVADYEAQLEDWRAIHAKLRQVDSEDIPECKEEENPGLNCVEAKIVTELSTYLGDRLGATLNDIRNHLRRKKFHCSPKNIAQLMRRFPALFKEETVASGPTMKIKWVFVGTPA